MILWQIAAYLPKYHQGLFALVIFRSQVYAQQAEKKELGLFF